MLKNKTKLLSKFLVFSLLSLPSYSALANITDDLSKLEMLRRKHETEMRLKKAPTAEDSHKLARDLEAAAITAEINALSASALETSTTIISVEDPVGAVVDKQLTKNTWATGFQESIEDGADTSDDSSLTGSGTISEFVDEHFNQYKLCSDNAVEFYKSFSSSSDGQPVNNPCATGADVVKNDFKDLSITTILENKKLEALELSYANSAAHNLTKRLWKNIVDPKNPDIEKIAKNLLSRASISVPLYSYHSMIDMRKPYANGKSKMEIMELESTKRIKDPKWTTDLATLPSEAILREMAQMQAVALWNQYHQYKQSERLEAVMAQMISKFSELSEGIQPPDTDAAIGAAAGS